MRTKYYEFLNGLRLPRSEYKTRGICMEESAHLLPEHLNPIIENDFISVRQDAEFPVPAFYIIGVKKQVESIADLDEKTAAIIGALTHIMRKAMREVLHIHRVNIYLEEKLKEPHYHKWLLPMWDDVLKKYDLEPRIWESNIMKYIKLFKFEEEGDKILEFNNKMKKYLKENYLDDPNSLLFRNQFSIP